MEKLKLIKLTQADPIQIDDKKNLFASKVIQLLSPFLILKILQ